MDSDGLYPSVLAEFESTEVHQSPPAVTRDAEIETLRREVRRLRDVMREALRNLD